MSNNLLMRLQAIVNHIDPQFRAQTQQDMDAVVDSGARSEADLLGILKDRSRPVGLRAIASWFLARLGHEEALPTMIDALSDEDVSLRAEAARSLGILGSKRVTLALVSALQNDENADVRLYAASSLAMLDDQRAVEPLVQTLQDPAEEARVRGMAAESLARFSESPAVVPLISALESDSPEVRYWAAFALGQLGDPRALPPLQRLASTDESAEVRKEASAAFRAARDMQGESPGADT